MSEIKLLPCPCCNGEAEFNEIGTQINCKECGLTLDVSECYEQGFSNARDTMIKKWNTRKPMERIIERLEKESEIADNELKRTIERNPMQTDFALGYKMAIKNAIKIIKIIKEECGINE